MPNRIQLLCSDRGLPADVFVNNQDGVWGGVDRGTKILLEQGIQPYLTVGDFDSVSDEERRWIAERTDISPVPAEKADTDLALGVVKAIEQGFEEIDIYGATGGRLDHFMGAMQLLKAPENQTYRIRLIDDQNEILLLTEGEHVIDRLLCYPYISFVPATDAVTLSLKGFKYNLDQEVLKIGSTLTISNEFQDKAATIYVHRGMVYQMRSRDK